MTAKAPNASEPYVGPRPYERADAHLFFGREREAEELLSLIIAHPVVLLYAQSGAGKTSLINAQLIPLLEEQYARVFGPARVGGEEREGDDEAAAGQNVFVLNALMSLHGEAAAPGAESLARMGFGDFLRAQPPEADMPEGITGLRVIIFDQFEELFTAHVERWQQREGFFAAVSDALDRDPHLRVLFALREEYLAWMDNFSRLVPEGLRTRFRLEGLREAQAKEAVRGPLKFTDRTITDEGLVKLVGSLLKVPFRRGERVEEVDAEYVEPVQLQLVCQDMWESLPPKVRRIDSEHVKQFADVDQALEKYYEKCLAQLAAENVDEGGLREWFERELITPQKTRNLVFLDERTNKANAGGLSKRSVLMLEKLRIIRPVPRGGATWYELTHERFITPILSSNVEHRRERAREKVSLADLEERAKTWDQSGRPTEQLLTDEEIKAVELVRKNLGEISESPLLKEYVLESETQRLKKSQQQLAQRARSLAGRLKSLVFALIVVGLLLVYAFVENRRAKDANERAERASQVLRGEQAMIYSGVRGKEYDALALGIEALGDPSRNVPRKEALDGIRAALRATDRRVWLRECVSSPGGYVFSPDGRRVMAIGDDKLHVWDAASGVHLYSRPEQGAVRWAQAAFSNSGRLLVAVGTALPSDRGQQRFGQITMDEPGGADAKEKKSVVLVLNADDGSAVASLQDKLQDASGVRMSKDEGRVLAILKEEEVAILDVAGGAAAGLRKPFPKDRWSHVDMSPDGRRVVGINDDVNGLEVWDAETGKQVSEPFDIGTTFTDQTTDTIKFSPDGRTGLLARETPGVASTAFVLWEAETGRKLGSFKSEGELGKVRHFAFMPDSRGVFVVGESLVRIYDLGGRPVTGRRLPAEKVLSYGEGFLLTLGGEGEKPSVSIWSADAADPARASTPLFETEGYVVQKAAPSPDRSYVLTATEDNITLIWETREPKDFDSYSPAELRKAACDKLRFQREFEQVKTQCGGR